MTVQTKEYKRGIRKPGPIGSIVAAATPITAYILPATRTCHLRKITLWNRNAANAQVQIGTGLGGAFAQALNGIFAVGAGNDLEVPEDQIPNVEFGASITAQSTVGAAAPNDVQIQVEVEEFPGTTG